MKLTDPFPINGQAICDCGNKSFFVGLLVTRGNNRIKLLECTECERQMAVPFREVNCGALET